MEKLIAHVSYWLGLVCLFIAVIWRIVSAFGQLQSATVITGRTVWYVSFFHGSILFFVTTIATAAYAWLKAKTP
jgi:hypothetical protein